jgi:hypothetical protein
MSDLQAFDSKAQLPDVVNPYDDLYGLLASGGSFLPRLQLFISSSEAVKNEKIAQNHYGLVTGKDQIEDLGREVDVFIYSWRPRAIDTSDRSNIRASSEVESDLFKDIQEKADEKNSGCLFGPEFLLWVPIKEVFATMLFGSKSARNEARNVQRYIKNPATFKSKLIKTNEYMWQAPLVTACSTPFSIPSVEKATEVMEEFLTPKEITGAEKVEEPSSARIR